jgi:hyperosmotically inducible periplasmic protein
MNSRSRFLRSSLLAAALAAAAATSLAAPRVTPNYNTQAIPLDQASAEDLRVMAAVINALSNDSRLSGNIAVQAQDGRVTLTGLVTTSEEIDTAVHDAQDVDGVQDVDTDGLSTSS